jgi:predicted kinase
MSLPNTSANVSVGSPEPDWGSTLGIDDQYPRSPGPGRIRLHVDRLTAGLGTVDEARLILTCGLPGAGKTELAKRLASTGSAVRLTKDEWLWALGATPWDEPTRQRVELELWRLAQEILGQGVSVVLDFGLWARIERDEMRLAARELGVGVELHYLDVEPDILWRRIEARNAEPPWAGHPIRHADLDRWLRVFQAPDGAELALFDSAPNSS